MRNRVWIGEHIVEIESGWELFRRTFHCFRMVEDGADIPPHIVIRIVEGYGNALTDYEVSVSEEGELVTFSREDFAVKATHDYSTALIQVHNELSLKHAIMTLYSSYIVKHRWGLMIHSSCVIDHGKAHLFAGPSGAGKSTVARLSEPRELLSDEATLVKLDAGGVIAFNSLFRSENETWRGTYSCPLTSIQLLARASHNERIPYSKSNGLTSLIDKVFYWSSKQEDRRQVFLLLKQLVDRVPVFELHFQKEDTFWELIG